MSTKCTVLYANTKDFMFHMYTDFAGDPGINIRFEKFETTLHLDIEQVNDIKRQLEEDYKRKVIELIEKTLRHRHPGNHDLCERCVLLKALGDKK